MTDYNYHDIFNANTKLHFEAIVGNLILSRVAHGETIPLQQLQYVNQLVAQHGYTPEVAKEVTELLL